MISLFLPLLFTFYLLHQINIYEYIVFHFKILYTERPRLAPLSTSFVLNPTFVGCRVSIRYFYPSPLDNLLFGCLWATTNLPSFQSQSEFFLTSLIPLKKTSTCAAYSRILSVASPGRIQYRPQLPRLRSFVQRKDFSSFHQSIVVLGHPFRSLFWSQITERQM